MLQDQEPWRLVDEDPDQHSHPLFHMSPGMKMLGAREREGIKRYRRRNEGFPRNEILYFHEIIQTFQKVERQTQTHQPSQPIGGRRTAGDRRGSQVQEPGTKTEAVICPGEQDRATQDQHSHHRPGIREQGTKGPKCRSSSLTRVSARATPTPKYQDDSKFFTKKTRSDSTSATGPRDKTDRFVTKSQHPRAQASGARRRLRSTIPPTRYNLWQTGTARTANDSSPQADQENLTAPTGYNGLPCDLSRVDWAGTVKPANRGAREVPKHNVTMTKAKDTALAPGRRATENRNMDYPKTPRPGLKRAIRQKNTPAGCPEELTEPLPWSEEPERHPRKGDNWTGTPEPKALCEKRKSPGEQDPWHFRASTSRIANHPEKVEMDKSTRRQG